MLDKMTPKAFMARKRVGLLLRVFATEERHIGERIKQIQQLFGAAGMMAVEGHNVFRGCDIVVWDNQQFGKRSDCGETHSYVRGTFHRDSTRVHHLTSGDLFCSALNRGIYEQVRHGMDYTLVMSTEAESYLTSETCRRIIEAACNGARAVGVAIGELEESILRGRLANTFCLWHNESLLQVGGFDKAAEMPLDAEAGRHVYGGWDYGISGKIYYPMQGVEEIVPLCRMAREFRPERCIAAVLPGGEGVQRYKVPDSATERDLWERHMAKMATKEMRQAALAHQAGFNLSCLGSSLMENSGQ